MVGGWTGGGDFRTHDPASTIMILHVHVHYETLMGYTGITFKVLVYTHIIMKRGTCTMHGEK